MHEPLATKYLNRNKLCSMSIDDLLHMCMDMQDRIQSMTKEINDLRTVNLQHDIGVEVRNRENGVVEICYGNHEAYEPCQWQEYVPRKQLDERSSNPTEWRMKYGL